MLKNAMTGMLVGSLILLGADTAWTKAKTASKQVPAKKAGWSHAPFEAGTCDICHAFKDPAKPGKIKKNEPGLCLDCHEQFGDKLAKYKFRHEATDSCSACHNPHNGENKLFLLASGGGLCVDCHDVNVAKHPKAKAALSGQTCVSCHNPHGSQNKGLKQPPPN